MCSLVRFCSSVHCRPGFKLCPRKLHSFFVQLFPDFVHMQLLQSSIQLSPTSLAAPLLSTQATAFSPNLPGEEATNAPVSSSSASRRTWQMISPLSQEQSLWFPLTSTPEDLASSSHTSSHSSHISRCCLRLPRSSTHSCSSLLTQNLKVQTGGARVRGRAR